MLRLRLSLLSCALAAAAASSAAAPLPLSVTVSSGAAPAHYVSREYVSFNLDWHFDGEEWPAWRGASVMNMSLDDPDLRFLTGALAPAHLRVGGSEGDLVVYELPGFPCALPPEQNATTNPVPFCLNASRWAAIHAFAAEARISLAFGLNAMAGRRNASSKMDTANLAAFLAATAAAGYDALNTLPWLEFGNELEYKVEGAVYAADLRRVAALVAAAWPDASRRPRLVANDENPDPSYWTSVLPLVGDVISAASWHEYVGYGLDPQLPTKALDAAFLDGIRGTAGAQVAAAAKARFPGDLWVGETALAWHSGRDNTTNAFASSFWYLYQLGELAATHTVQCRQTLYGGSYELIDKTSKTPNPDWWLAHLWKRTMGEGVLAAALAPAAAAPQVRVWAHCAAAGSGGAPRRGVTLGFLNLDAAASYALNVSAVGGAGGGGGGLAMTPRLEYHLAAPGGDATSRTALLNGAPLTYGGPGRLDPAAPAAVSDPATPLVIAPRTLGFIVFPDAETLCE